MTNPRTCAIAVVTTFIAALAASTQEAAPSKGPVFPADWVGHWSGPAALIAPGRPDRDFVMELIVKPTDDPARYQWTIIYAEANGTKQERAYELVVRDAEKGRFAIDEKNGIIIPATHLDGALYTSFEVQGTRINTREKLEHFATPDELLSVEMISGSSENAEPSGGKDAVPEVRSVVPRSLQRATLKRVAEKPSTP